MATALATPSRSALDLTDVNSQRLVRAHPLSAECFCFCALLLAVVRSVSGSVLCCTSVVFEACSFRISVARRRSVSQTNVSDVFNFTCFVCASRSCSSGTCAHTAVAAMAPRPTPWTLACLSDLRRTLAFSRTFVATRRSWWPCFRHGVVGCNQSRPLIISDCSHIIGSSISDTFTTFRATLGIYRPQRLDSLTCDWWTAPPAHCFSPGGALDARLFVGRGRRRATHHQY